MIDDTQYGITHRQIESSRHRTQNDNIMTRRSTSSHISMQLHTIAEGQLAGRRNDGHLCSQQHKNLRPNGTESLNARSTTTSK